MSAARLAAQSNRTAVASNLLKPVASYLRAVIPRTTKIGRDEDAMPRFGNERYYRDWLGTVAVLAAVAGFLFSGYLIAGLAGLLK